jgi:hypothetical protein
VLVKNGTTVGGLAADATTSLQAQGYNAETSHATPAHTAVTTIEYAGSREQAKAKQVAALYPGSKLVVGGYGTQIVVTLGDDYAAAHPKGGGAGTTSGAPTSGSTAPAGGGGALPTEIANNSRTADQDICSGITAGYGAGTG